MDGVEKMILAYCVPSISMIGGGQRVLATKTCFFVEHFGYEVHIIVTDEGNRKPCFDLHPKIKVHDLDLNYVKSMPLYQRPFFYLYKRYLHKRRLNKCLNTIKPDITILMTRRELPFIFKMTDGSIKIAENHFEKDYYMNDADWTLRRYCPALIWNWYRQSFFRDLAHLHRFVLLTYQDMRQWKGLNNLVVIPNALTNIPSVFSKCLSQQVIAVGRYVPQKGFDLLIKAWKKVVLKDKKAILRIFGDGILRQELQNQINKAGLSESCFLEYPTIDIEKKYMESSIFVLSSRFEGFGMVLIEAMACGLPVISFDCPCGPQDIITDSEDGILVKSGDVDMLADRIIYLLEHPEERQQMGHNARLKAKKYKIDNIATQWRTLFEELKAEKKKDRVH